MSNEADMNVATLYGDSRAYRRKKKTQARLKVQAFSASANILAK